MFMQPIRNEILKSKKKVDEELKSKIDVNTQLDILNQVNENTLENIEQVKNAEVEEIKFEESENEKDENDL